jgi:hypothetical protein
MMRRYMRYWRQGPVTYGSVLVGVPALLAAAALWSGGSPVAAPSSDPATMWLPAANGRLVRANALVAVESAQIVDCVPLPVASAGVRLVNVPGGVVAAAGDGALTRVDTTTRAVVTAPADSGTVVGDGERLYRVPPEGLVMLDAGSLEPTATHRLGRIAGWATAPGALYVATADGAVSRVDGNGVDGVRSAGAAPPRLAGTADGVAGFDGDHGEIFRIRGGRQWTVAHTASGTADAFAATPDARRFALLRGRELTVITDGAETRLSLTFDPGPPVLDGDVVYLPDRAAGTVHLVRVDAGFHEQKALSFGAPGRLDLDVRRNHQFLWLDDVRGRFAWAVHDGHPQRIAKYAAPRAAVPPPSPSATVRTPPPHTRPPRTTPPTRTTEPSATATTTRTPSPSKSAKPRPSRSPSRPAKPSPSPSASKDPLKRCDGKPTLLSVADASHTGKHPRITVTICEKASGREQYWIVSHSAGAWFAKEEIDSERTYTVDLLNGSGETGEDRDFVIVAGRTGAGRDWLRRNRAADTADDAGFPRDGLPDGVETISDPVSTTS